MTTPTRYGTSCAEHPEGCFVKFSEYEKVVAERDALLLLLDTPIAMKVKWSPLESTLIDGWSPEVAVDALGRGKKLTIYYGQKKEHAMAAKEKA